MIIIRSSEVFSLAVVHELMDKFGARLGEISIAELDRFRAATIYAYEKVIES